MFFTSFQIHLFFKGVLREAQAQSNAQISSSIQFEFSFDEKNEKCLCFSAKITEQVAALGQEDASRRLASTTTTVITTKAAASSETTSK